MNQLPPTQYKSQVDNENKVAKFLKILGITFIVFGFLGGNVMGEELGRYGFSFFYFSIGLFSGLVSGMFLIGLSEIIKLLHNISDKM